MSFHNLDPMTSEILEMHLYFLMNRNQNAAPIHVDQR